MKKIWIAMMVSFAALAACAVEPGEEGIGEEEQALVENGRSYLQEPLKLELEEAPRQDCFTATCTVGLAGNRFCTDLCGDVARCTPPMTTGCGPRPCCVLQ